MSTPPHPATLQVIPPEDVKRQIAGIAGELQTAFEAVVANGQYVFGPQLSAFESEFAAYCSSRYAIGISSGTESLHLALLALGVGPGDEVVTVPNTYVATVFAITYCGATPVFVDVDEQSGNMAPAAVAAAVTPRTKAIIPVHMYGQCANVDAIRDAAPGIPILEDAAHAHGATLHDRKAGSLGDIAAFSFFPSKVMGALGDGGMITTSDQQLDAKVHQLRWMGQINVKYEHLALGYQERLDELQAAFLRVKLVHLEQQIAGRRHVAARYRELLADTPLDLPPDDVTGRHVYYMFTVHTDRREEMIAFLENRGIRTQVMYPKLIPDQTAYKDLPWRAADDLSVARSLVPRLLALPMFAELRDDEVERVGEAIRAFFRDARDWPSRPSKTLAS
jgi:dTDP-4-amino-4,6-dideoxygalactose transaminase